jgi:hypothetical protein
MRTILGAGGDWNEVGEAMHSFLFGLTALVLMVDCAPVILLVVARKKVLDGQYEMVGRRHRKGLQKPSVIVSSVSLLLSPQAFCSSYLSSAC